MDDTPVSPLREDRWRARNAPSDLGPYLESGRRILEEIERAPAWDDTALAAILKRHPRSSSQTFGKNLLLRLYRHLCEVEGRSPDPDMLGRLRRKPVRTRSGVAPVTVLTKPFPCPGRCIFCPTDARMPKSYLPDEPGAMRAEQNEFDPHAQVASRLRALRGNGHAADKVELLILGGTWSSYPRDYQTWFIQRCLDAMNGQVSTSLEQAQFINETAEFRNVGLVVETRPDHVRPQEVRWLRKLGVTKVQMGAQSLDDDVLRRNRRGHDVTATRRAMELLRAAGLKLVLHWMPNLLGSNPTSDKRDFRKLFDDPSLCPDEIKIYPCALLRNAELYQDWVRGDYLPYDDETLIDLIADCKRHVPVYCRINRVIRDIPAGNVVAGSRVSNLRQSVQKRMKQRNQHCRCIRCREVRGRNLSREQLLQRAHEYATTATHEIFLSWETDDGSLAGYLRLSLPTGPSDLDLDELSGAALVREVHVYGPALAVGAEPGDAAQHRGLGTQLLREAEDRARDAGFERLAVIASVGTRRYYAARGYARRGTYMVKELTGGA